MIHAEATRAFNALAQRLEDRAVALATARAIRSARPDDPRRWRSAALVWPLFGKDLFGKG